MLKSDEKFYTVKGKRQVLIVDDEPINRELLGGILAEDYELLYAADGEEALAICRQRKDTLSLMLLDLMMPVLSGIDVLKCMREDGLLSEIPVIVVTADQNAEIESLNLGAVDFIPKPYPQPGVILARVLRTIELYEDREIITQTERDPLTGLYNREYFYSYAEQIDQHHPDAQMDAIVLDVNRFHILNERFGTAYGDEVLRRIGQRTREMVVDSGGIVCRREADTFLIYCPHGRDYEAFLERASEGLIEEDADRSRVRMRMGVYPRADKALEIERRFDRAQVAADRVQGSVTHAVGIYDSTLHEKELYAEQLIDDFRKAIDECQFTVFYQPKFDVRPDTPVLISAEALVRWQHPQLGMVSPGTFIPLFEENGLIQELDTYVWREAARQMRDWRDRLGHAVPVSVNMSRIDMYDPDLLANLQSILRENGLTSKDIILEVTESAYTQDSRQIIETVEHLRKLGFRIEMDDFGTGYSSLNMISHLPVDALKLDMQFIRSAFSEGDDTRMLRVVIDMAACLGVPVIAEGVETERQMRALRAMGCDIVQGYYFSKPVPAGEFERFIEEARAALSGQEERPSVQTPSVEAPRPEAPRTRRVFGTAPWPEEAPAAPVHVDPEPGDRRGLQLRTTSYFFVIIAVIAAVALFISDISVTRGYQRMQRASGRYIAAQMAASNMESGSDYLTDRVRCFVVTGEIEYLRDFFEEVEVTRRRDQALEDLGELLEGSNSSAYNSLATALELSNELLEKEYLAMRLMLEAGGYDAADVPEVITGIRLSPEEAALSPEAQKERAQSLVFDNAYMHYKDRIRENVSLCTQELILSSSLELEQASSKMALFVSLQTTMTLVFLAIVLLIVVFIELQVRRPLTRMVAHMRSHDVVPVVGAEELQFVTRIYNAILRENREAHERLSHEASHDPLTGLFNRGAYEMMLKSVDTEHMALILIDVDYFKQVNDRYGHDVGDRVLKRVAEILKHSFRSVDVICRIGGDEFVVIMTRADSTMKDLVRQKIARANDQLRHPQDDLPAVSLSVGVAFSDRENPRGDIFKDADTALYRVKEAGHCGCEVF